MCEHKDRVLHSSSTSAPLGLAFPDLQMAMEFVSRTERIKKKKKKQSAIQLYEREIKPDDKIFNNEIDLTGVP